MATLEARINALEKKAPSTEGMRWIVILTAMGEADEPLTKLACTRTGRVWEIQEGETRGQFTSRIEKDAFPDGAAGVLMVTRVA